jgi:predicted lipase
MPLLIAPFSESDLTDIDVPMTSLSPTLFPNLPKGILVHEGFANEHARTASTVMANVKKIISEKGASSVTLVSTVLPLSLFFSDMLQIGHSLGGALALLDTAFMAQNLPTSMPIKMVTYGMPRVGNPAFASYISSIPRVSLTHINNDHDPIPIVPGRFLGFAHPIGEVHITNDDKIDGTWVNCPGQDDATDSQCEIATVPNIFLGNILDHLGPYNGVYMGTIFCN